MRHLKRVYIPVTTPSNMKAGRTSLSRRVARKLYSSYEGIHMIQGSMFWTTPTDNGYVLQRQHPDPCFSTDSAQDRKLIPTNLLLSHHTKSRYVLGYGLYSTYWMRKNTLRYYGPLGTTYPAISAARPLQMTPAW